jgi:hypothetical protein
MLLDDPRPDMNPVFCGEHASRSNGITEDDHDPRVRAVEKRGKLQDSSEEKKMEAHGKGSCFA